VSWPAREPNGQEITSSSRRSGVGRAGTIESYINGAGVKGLAYDKGKDAHVRSLC
jgi:hypothetical protein